MYIIPYFFGSPIDFKPDGNLHSLWIFMTEGGTQFWKTDESDSKKSADILVTEYLTENEFRGSLTGVKGDCLFFQVDRHATKLTSFYTWPEGFGVDTEGWRPFFWLTDSGKRPGDDHDTFQFGRSLAEIPVPFIGLEGVSTIKDLWMMVQQQG
jgi:hypothetical protein